MTNINELIWKSQSMEETNEILESNNLPSYNHSLSYSFRLRKKVYFMVEFGHLKDYERPPYFSTSGGVFNYIRSDWNRCGQCQDSVLQNNTVAKRFYDKWDKLHTKSLTMEEYHDLLNDLEEMKEQYPYVESTRFNIIVEHDREMSNQKKVKK